LSSFVVYLNLALLQLLDDMRFWFLTSMSPFRNLL
jgi:hypothetical protein